MGLSVFWETIGMRSALHAYRSPVTAGSGLIASHRILDGYPLCLNTPFGWWARRRLYSSTPAIIRVTCSDLPLSWLIHALSMVAFLDRSWLELGNPNSILAKSLVGPHKDRRCSNGYSSPGTRSIVSTLDYRDSRLKIGCGRTDSQDQV